MREPTYGQPVYDLDMFDRVLARCIEGAGGCWVWRGGTAGNGHYGRIQRGPVRYRTHRVTYEYLIGPVPDGLELDHLCKVRLCCNPYHLDVVTHRENILRSDSPAGVHAAQTHCVKGHEFTPENTYRPPSWPEHWRVCRQCKKDSRVQERERKKDRLAEVA
jgi:hypothetical protein